MKINCWEFHQCGQEPGGAHCADKGPCPAATLTALNGINDGQNGGRACWAVLGTLCQGGLQNDFTEKLSHCTLCAFHKQVQREQNKTGTATQTILKILKRAPASCLQPQP